MEISALCLYDTPTPDTSVHLTGNNHSQKNVKVHAARAKMKLKSGRTTYHIVGMVPFPVCLSVMC